MFNTDDTIVAVSTPAGIAARGIVRLSGPEAFSIAERFFQPHEQRLAELPGFHATDGLLTLPPATTLPARAYVFRRPRSFTRQDLIEIHLPSCPPLLNALVADMIQSGARSAEPGEFTARAFFSGRIDLAKAESVADIIHATDLDRHRAALAGLGGRLSRICASFSDALAETLASVEASIDLADEDLELDRPDDLARQLAQLSERIERTADQAADLPETSEQPTVTLTGRANVGKSSLLNALSQTDRAIVSAMAGTTRDVLRADLTLPCGQTVSLLDAAGFLHPQTPLDAASHTAARQAIARADTILFVTDACQADPSVEESLLRDVRETNPSAPLLMLANKIDRCENPAPFERTLAERYGLDVLGTSAVTGQGLDALKTRLTEVLHLSAGRSGETLGLHQRQKRCLQLAAQAARRAAQLLEPADTVSDVAELAAIELREALAQIGHISGEVVTEDILGKIFRRFCVGK